MGDPLSLAAGIVGLVSLTIQLLQVANKFKDDVKGVGKEVAALIEELNALNSVLEMLKKAWEHKRAPANIDLSALARIETTCEAQLNELLEKLRKNEVRLQKKPYASVHGAMARIRWPLEADRTRDITNCIHRYFCIFSWALSCSDSNILYGTSEDVCKALRYQEKALDEIFKLFSSVNDLRQHVETGIFTVSSVLRIIEAKSTTLDEFCREMKTLNIAHTETRVALDDVKSDLREIRKDTATSDALHRVEGTLAQIEQKTRERHNVIEKYNAEQGIASLSSIPYLERQRQAYASHEPGTGAWFLSHNHFRSWKESDATSTLICTGPPGTGKTVLTSLAIDDISRSSQKENVQIAHLFCQYKHQANETAPELFTSLLQQLLTSRGAMWLFVRDKCLELFSKPPDARRLLKELVQLVRILCGASRRTYILVDAVDEILETDTGGKDIRNEFLRSLFELSGHCRLFITCRTHINLSMFSTMGSLLRVRAKDEDISTYCDSTICASKVLLDFCRRRPGLQNEIIHAIKAKSNGVFLLANRHMRRLVSAISARDVQEILKSLSSNLDEVWGFCMERLECQSPNRRALAKRALSWVSRALRPLTDLELAHALSYRPGDTDFDPMSCIDVSMIIEVCDGMLQLEPAAIFHKSGRPVISFTHASVADFLSQELVIDDIHLDFANTSLGYVSMQGLQAEDIRHIHHTQYQFLNYAMSNWADHASRSIGDIKVEFLLAFARKSPRALIEAARRGLHDALHFLLDNGISPNRYHKTHSPLSIAATYGQLLCASYLVEAGAHVDYAGDHNQLLETALTLAIRSGHSQVVLLLIDSNADLNAGRMPPIFAAVLSNRPTIVRKLLSAGCDPDVRYEGRTAIMTALDKGRLGIAETLILGGADLHARYGVGNETLLSKAMWHRSWDFAAKLIDQGADAKNDTSLVQLLKPAAYEGAEELVQQILQVAGHRPSPSVEEEDEAKTASTPASAHSYKTPLHLALEGRHHDIAMQLIRSGLGINRLCGTPPYTPLEWTAGHNNVELVKELITAGADPNRGGEATPLMSAVSRFVQADNFHDTQTTEVIALLLDAGADPHARSSKETDQLTIQVADNLRFRWWSKSDTNVQRLLISLQLPDSWVVT